MNGWSALDRFLRTDPRDVGCAEAMDLLHVYAELAAAAVFSGRIPLSGPGQLLGPVRLAEGDLYVLCGLAVLAGMAVALVREQSRTVLRLYGVPGTSEQCPVNRPGQPAAPRTAASSPSKSSPHGPQARR